MLYSLLNYDLLNCLILRTENILQCLNTKLDSKNVYLLYYTGHLHVWGNCVCVCLNTTVFVCLGKSVVAVIMSNTCNHLSIGRTKDCCLKEGCLNRPSFFNQQSFVQPILRWLHILLIITETANFPKQTNPDVFKDTQSQSPQKYKRPVPLNI